MTPARERGRGREESEAAGKLTEQTERWREHDNSSPFTFRSYSRDLTKDEVSVCLSHTCRECYWNKTEFVLGDTLRSTHAALTMIYPSCGFMHTQTFSLYIFHTCVTLKTAGDPFSLLTNTQCSVSADKLIPIIFKCSGGGGGSRSSLFSIMLSALNIVYSICSRAGRRLLWSVLFFQQSISDIALFSWDRVIFLHWPRNITPPLMESRCRHPYPPRFE